MSPARSESGFSLIEMSLVLIVIGLLITAITVGKDVLRTAELNRVFTDGVGQWVRSAYIYYEKTGKRLECSGALWSNGSGSCPQKLAQLGLTGGLVELSPPSDTYDAKVSYNDSTGTARYVLLDSVTNCGTNGQDQVCDNSDLKLGSTVTLAEDQINGGQEGLLAVKGSTNGTVTPATLATAATLTFTLSQYGAGN